MGAKVIDCLGREHGCVTFAPLPLPLAGLPTLDTGQRASRGIVAGVSLWAILGSVSCQKHEPFIGHVSQSMYFEYHEHSDQPLCPTLQGLLDQNAGLILGKLGASFNPGNRFRYYHFIDSADFSNTQSDCPASWNACAFDGVVYSTSPFDAHEQAHDYVFRAFGTAAPGLLAEGQAVAVSCTSAFSPGSTTPETSLPPGSSWQSLLYLKHGLNSGYYAAGVFVTYLVQHFGWAKLGELNQRVGPAIAPADFEREFARVYPMSMDDAWASALGTPNALPCFADWVCTGLDLPAWSAPIVPDCDGEMHRSISVHDVPGIVLSLTGEGATLNDCSASARYELQGQVNLATTHWASLPSGRYGIAHWASPPPSSFTFEGTLNQSIVSATCNTAAPIVLRASQNDIVDLPAGTVTGFIRVDGGGASFTVSISQILQSTGDVVEVCTSCADDAVCTSASGQSTAPLPIADGTVVRLNHALVLSPWGQIYFLPSAK